ncbi:MAG: two-component system response regulator [Hyphomicrobiales bacterium]|nr:MAG: two-component system response regulator [Hyphomicrobiales bacterium]
MINPPLSILVIDENAARASVIDAGLREAGYEAIKLVNTLDGMEEFIALHDPDAIIVDMATPNPKSLDRVFELSRAVKRPFAIFVDSSDRDSTHAAMNAGVSAYVVDGLKKERVPPILDMAISRFAAYAKLEQELAEAKTALSSQKIIDQAKRILMKSRDLSEDEAYALMRKTAMDQNRKMSDLAQNLIMAADLLSD